MSALSVSIEAPADVERARGEMRRLCGLVGLDARSCEQMTAAVAALGEGLFVARRRAGALSLALVSQGGRLGVEASAQLAGGQRVDVPAIEELVDELETGFTRWGGVRVRARKWRKPPAAKAFAAYEPERLQAGAQ